MTTEEKAKAYDEAIERAKKLIDKGYDVLMPEIFPELKESEDERIRKELIKKVRFYIDGDIPCGYDAKKALAWLEKQGEQSLANSAKTCKVEPKFKVGDFIQYKGMGHERYTIKEVCGTTHYINSYGKRMDMPYTDANFELVEQKPAEWSEEDEEMLQAIILDYKGEIEHLTDKDIDMLVKTVYKKRIDWLKSLRLQK